MAWQICDVNSWTSFSAVHVRMMFRSRAGLTETIAIPVHNVVEKVAAVNELQDQVDVLWVLVPLNQTTDVLLWRVSYRALHVEAPRT